MALVVRTCLPIQETKETQVQSLGQKDPLEEAMATHSSIPACRIPWTEEPGRLGSKWLQIVRQNWSDLEESILTLKYCSEKFVSFCRSLEFLDGISFTNLAKYSSVLIVHSYQSDKWNTQRTCAKALHAGPSYSLMTHKALGGYFARLYNFFH